MIVERRYTGMYNATGESLDARFCHVWAIRGGKGATFQQYTDSARFQEVMGVSADRGGVEGE